MQMTKKISIGIEGLNRMLHGGLRKGRNILVTGPSGSGKTTIASHFLYEGCMHNDEPGLYISLEEQKNKIFEDLKTVGVDLELIEKKGNFHFLGGPIANISSYMKKIDADPEHIIREIESVIIEKNIKRVTIDCINLLTMLSRTKSDMRELLAKLCNILSSNGCTSLLLSELSSGSDRISENGIEEFIVDGVIVLYHLKQGSKFIPGLAIKKMRGSAHDRDIRPYNITSKGVIVYPEEVMFVID